jgi:two-component system NtrC family sensor kinase
MPRVLIVEDDAGFRTMLETMVRLEGHDVSLAGNGEAGLQQAASRKAEIVISDVDMPGMTGIQLVKKLKASPDTAAAYVILLTGQGGQDAKLDALRAGADDFLEKPSSRQEILGRLEIAQKVMAVQRLQREAEARAASLEVIPKKVLDSLGALDKGLASAEDAIAKKNPAALVAAVKEIKDAAVGVRGACGGAAAPSEGSWL